MQKIIEDKDLGTVVLRKYIRSRNYTIRLKQGKVCISLPCSGTYQKALGLLEKYRSDLIVKQKQYIPSVESLCDETLLRKKAHDYLPLRLKLLAEQYHFTYNILKINKSRGRWGSCSNKKNINLSFYLMTLPLHLIDYVLLHELCHTKEMNHGVRFWALLDDITGGKAKELSRELKGRAKR